MNDFFTLAQEASSGVATLTLCRPERLNTLAPAFFPALRDAVRGLADAGRTRALLLQSTGRHFTAGMALEVFAGSGLALATASARDRLAFAQALRRLMACFDALDEAPFPVVCAVQGGCVGGGLDLAAACDMRVCSADAFFTVQEIHIGMAADLGSLQRLPKVMAPGLARQMAYTGERLDAPRALAAGLVNAVLPDAAALAAHAAELATSIATKSPLAVAASKQALNYSRDHGLREALDHMAVLQSAVFDLGEMGRAIAAWQAKQTVNFEPLSALAPAGH